MRFGTYIDLDAPLEVVVGKMVADRDAVKARHEALGHRGVEVLQCGEGEGGLVVSVGYAIKLAPPGFAARIASPPSRVVQTERWTLGVDRAVAHFDLDLGIAPGTIEGTMRLEPTQRGTRIDVDGNVKVKVPVVGARLTRWLADYSTTQMKSELDAGRTYFASEYGLDE